jgi:hypothetical protein
MPVTGFDEWSRNLDAFQKQMRKVMTDATNVASRLVFDEQKGLASAIDHTLEDLRRLGHPYSWHFPAGSLHPDYIVHTQREEKGESLLQGLQRLPARYKNGIIRSEIHSHAAHTWHVILGTRRMRPRDFVSAALIVQRNTVASLYENAHSALHDQARSGGFLIELTKMAHDRYPAELPEEI